MVRLWGSGDLQGHVAIGHFLIIFLQLCLSLRVHLVLIDLRHLLAGSLLSRERGLSLLFSIEVIVHSVFHPIQCGMELNQSQVRYVGELAEEGGNLLFMNFMITFWELNELQV
jgi:hypothetical protein